MRRPWVAALLVCCACHDLPPVHVGVCGNGVLEAGEDCDGVAPSGLSCGAPVRDGAACRFVCDAEGDCPPAWSCGTAQVCLRPGGAPRGLEEAALPGTRWVSGDFDRDGHVDVAAAIGGVVQIAFGDGTGGFDVKRELSPLVPGEAPMVRARLNADGADDLVVAAESGTVVLQGTAGGEPRVRFVPTEMQAGLFVWTFPLRPPGKEPVAQMHLFIDRDDHVRAFWNVPSSESNYFPVSLSATIPPAEITHTVLRVDATADVDEQVLLPLATLPAMLRFSLGLDPGGKLEIKAGILDLGGPAGPSPQLADLDGDGKPDLLLEQEGKAVVMRGLDGGGFGPALPLPSLDAASVSRVQAVADLDGDGRTDLVGRRSLILARGDAFEYLTFAGVAGSWSEVATGDFDGDGRVDVAGASAAPPSIEVLLVRCQPSSIGGCYPAVARVPVALPKPPHHLRAGDFDCDGKDDIAYLTDGEGGTELWVLYDAATPGSEPASQIVLGAGFESLEAGPAWINGLRPDACADLFLSTTVTSRTTGKPVMGEGTLLGNAGHRLVPLENLDLAEQVVYGHFLPDADPGTDDGLLYFGKYLVIQRGRDAPYNLLQLPKPPSPDEPFTLDSDLQPGCALFDKGDFDGDGLEEPIAVRGGSACAGASPELLRFQLVHVPDNEPSLRILRAPAAETGPLTALLVADVDADGISDVVVGTEKGVTVLWDPGRHGEGSTHVALPSPVHALALLEADGEPGLELAVLDDPGVELVHVQGRDLSLSPSRFIDWPGATQLLAADLNEDRLTDLLVGDGQIARPYLIEAERP